MWDPVTADQILDKPCLVVLAEALWETRETIPGIYVCSCENEPWALPGWKGSNMLWACFRPYSHLSAFGDFPGGPVVKSPPSKAEDVGLIPAGRTKIPRAAGQLTPHTATTQPMCLSESVCCNWLVAAKNNWKKKQAVCLAYHKLEQYPQV